MFQKEYFFVLYWLNTGGERVNASGIITVPKWTTASKAFTHVLQQHEEAVHKTVVITEFRRVH